MPIHTRIQPPTKHLSTEFHFDGGWSVEFIKEIGNGYKVTVELNLCSPETGGVPVQRLWEFEASQSNMPTQRNARYFGLKALALYREEK